MNASMDGLFQKPDVSEVVCQAITNSLLTVECSKLCQVKQRPKSERVSKFSLKSFGEKEEEGVQWPLIGKKCQRQEEGKGQSWDWSPRIAP